MSHLHGGLRLFLCTCLQQTFYLHARHKVLHAYKIRTRSNIVIFVITAATYVKQYRHVGTTKIRF